MNKIPKWKDISLTFQGLFKYLIYLKISQYWTHDEIKKYQFKKLKFLLIECYENVPYYTDLFKKINFNPQYDFNLIEDIKKIPILTKEIAKTNKLNLRNKNYNKKCFPLRTSGSTGQPFEVYISFNAWVVEQAVVWRHWFWGGYKFRDEMAIVRSFSPKNGEPLIKFDRLRNFTYYSPFHLNDENMEYYLSVMIERKTKVLRGYPSSILTLAQYAKKSNKKLKYLKLILTASEVLTESDRCFIEDAFNTKISNHYGLAEVCVMMGDCNKHIGLHNYDEYGYVEFLPTENNQFSKIVGTNLHNYAMPLIRYETGDIAEHLENCCNCGRSLTSVKNIMGRSDTNILTPENYKIPTVNFYTMFEKFQKISSWQIIQHRIDLVEVILHSENITNNELNELSTELDQRLPRSISTTLSLNKPFIRINEGKKNVFLSLLE
jgi:phenylacetate-CoA ligase